MKKISLLMSLVLLFISASCSDDDSSNNSGNVPQNLEVQNFIWKGLNTYYFWKDQVPNLANDRFSSQDELNNFIANYQPDPLFESLLYQRNVTDKWSWIVDDYVALEKSFQGVTKSNGMEFRLYRFKDSPSQVYGEVIYVIPNSDAKAKGITRGDIFTKVNGTGITESNYRDLLFSSDSYTISLANYNGGNPVENGTTKDLVKTELDENPVFINEVIEQSGKKIGYLMYNGFVSSYDKELNNAFGQLKAEGVTDLIIDLRYNGGGSVRTATYLSSMVTGQFTGQVASKEKWNAEVQDYFVNNNPGTLENHFVSSMTDGTAIQSLQLDNLYVITTNNTASASELLINSLLPYINVKTIGQTTSGKYVGSITIYDSTNFGREGANPNHTWAMQPIVLSIENKNGVNFPQGIAPTEQIGEQSGNLGVLGDENEPLLNAALGLITGSSSATSRVFQSTDFNEEFDLSKTHAPNFGRMYIDYKTAR
ncbi:S41 family peptidase [Aureivirga marina]|uniref:S41 family peptidase n=1 Tax=Aureivirga marina TaxID=1182451 RepID=UPI0018C9FEB5|nr:S41 family peptidase [Aureivirga marina]